MDKAEILRKLRERKIELHEMGVQTLALFGSVAREEATPESDVDILVSIKSPVTFDAYMDIKFYLEDLLGTPVDLIIDEALRPQVRPYVQMDAIYVA